MATVKDAAHIYAIRVVVSMIIFLMSSDFLAINFDFCHLSVLERIETYHLPVLLSISFPNHSSVNIDNNINGSDTVIEKIVWNSDYLDVFDQRLNDEETTAMLDHVTELIDEDVDLALGSFNNCILKVAECMKKSISVNKKKKSHGWFDIECSFKRKCVRKLLKICRKSPDDNDVRHSFCKERREYKHLLERKEKLYNQQMLNKLLSSVDNQQEFWNVVHNTMPKRGVNINQISVDQWFEHFQKLLQKDDFVDGTDDEIVFDEDTDNYFLNRPISVEEVQFAIRKLKLKKSAGPDGIVGEMLKYACDKITPFFVRFLNALFDKGVFPESWTESIILPLFKKGDVNSPRNYRGISLCNISSKSYRTIINKRLQTWVDENNITGEHQAGFKKGYSTTDHIFTLLACVQRQFNLNRKLYVAFIDFQKAFDSINRNLLWPILIKKWY